MPSKATDCLTPNATRLPKYATLTLTSLPRRSSLSSGSEGDTGFSEYEAAARRGSQGGDCAAHYKECALPAAPVKATLRKLLTLLLAA